jgi:hypothetical protein
MDGAAAGVAVLQLVSRRVQNLVRQTAYWARQSERLAPEMREPY